MFRRRRRDPELDEIEPGDDESAEEPTPAAAAGDAVAVGDGASSAAPVSGPHDGAPPDGDELARLDLGGLLVPVLPEVEVRVEVDQQHGTVVAATLVHGQSALQVNAFAAPRNAGIWAEVREEILTSLRSSGGQAEEVAGPFGPELRAQVPAEGGTLAPARFLGVDGPRWFLRGLLSGAAASQPAQAALLEEAFRQVVVVRGGEAMAPRDQIPLRLPREAMEAAQAAAEQAAAEQGQQQQGFNPFERGPEISEVR